jgi:hypothetical protein
MFADSEEPVSLTRAVALIAEKLGLTNEDNWAVVEQGSVADQLNEMIATTGASEEQLEEPTLVESINEVASTLGAYSEYIETSNGMLNATEAMVDIASLVGLNTIEADSTFVEDGQL